MIPEIGSIYGKHAIDPAGCHFERRRVLDVTNVQVLYEIVLDPLEGTHVELMPVSKQVSMKDWRIWAENASIENDE